VPQNFVNLRWYDKPPGSKLKAYLYSIASDEKGGRLRDAGQEIRNGRVGRRQQLRLQAQLQERRTEDLRRRMGGEVGVSEGGEEAVDAARLAAARPPLPLGGGRPADPVRLQHGDVRQRVEGLLLHLAGVNDVDDVVEGDAGLRDVGGEDELATARGRLEHLPVCGRMTNISPATTRQCCGSASR
jgi:hypothetical protein